MSGHHPLPWRVVYSPMFPEWDAKSMPRIVDANGETVIRIPQSEDVHHPGLHDAKANETADRIVNAINSQEAK